MKPLSEKSALERLDVIISNFRSEISDKYEHRAKSCLTCEVKGACCLDAHFVNVRITRLEAEQILHALEELPEARRRAVYERIEASVKKYGLTPDGDTYSQTFACPLFEPGTGCLVHERGKPAPCISHACYESRANLPPEELLSAVERKIDVLNARAYGTAWTSLPLPLALLNRAREKPGVGRFKV